MFVSTRDGLPAKNVREDERSNDSCVRLYDEAWSVDVELTPCDLLVWNSSRKKTGGTAAGRLSAACAAGISAATAIPAAGRSAAADIPAAWRTAATNIPAASAAGTAEASGR